MYGLGLPRRAEGIHKFSVESAALFLLHLTVIERDEFSVCCADANVPMCSAHADDDVRLVHVMVLQRLELIQFQITIGTETTASTASSKIVSVGYKYVPAIADRMMTVRIVETWSLLRSVKFVLPCCVEHFVLAVLAQRRYSVFADASAVSKHEVALKIWNAIGAGFFRTFLAERAQREAVLVVAGADADRSYFSHHASSVCFPS